MVQEPRSPVILDAKEAEPQTFFSTAKANEEIEQKV